MLKSIASLYMNNEQVEFEIKSTMPYIVILHQNEILSYKSNKIHTKSIWGKLQKSDELIKKTK